MTFQSILFHDSADRVPEDGLRAPDFFADLNLDQIVAAVTAGKQEYALTPLFHMPLRSVEGVIYRHEVMRDLEDAHLFDSLCRFAQTLRAVREHLAETGKRYHQRQKERWFLDAVGLYGDAVIRLARDLSEETLRSRGLVAFKDYVSRYASSEAFISRQESARQLAAELAAIRYSLVIHGPRVEVRDCRGEPDYSAEIGATFDRFKQDAVQGRTFKFGDSNEMNHVESRILELVAEAYRDAFTKLATYCVVHKDFLDPTIVSFDREIQFYVAYLEHIAIFKKAGLKFCYPQVSRTRKDVHDRQGFDLALAGKLASKQAVPVANDFYLADPERMIVVSGPNQGGKTTFARTFGQLHYLASLGYPVPGSEAQLFLPDRIFTHFEKEERMTNLRGKLQDDLVRIHAILEAATPRSIVVINEIFASTTLRDAIVLSQRIAADLLDLDVLAVWVTFIDEVSAMGNKAVSMVSTVVPENPALRTFKIIRQPADGLAYAMSIAEKHRLTYAMIKERIRP